MVMWEALDALSHELELCGLDSTVRVVAIFDPAADPERVALVRAALARSGADAVELHSVHARRIGSSPEQSLIEVIAETADVVVDCRSVAADADGGDRLRSGSGRLLRLGPGSERPQDWPPHVNLGRRMALLLDRLGESDRLTVHDPNGTYLDVSLRGAELDHDAGVVDASTPVATYPAGWVSVRAGDRSARGDLVVMPGDSLPEGRRIVSSPVRFRIDDGRITDIGGDSSDADTIRALLERSGDPAAYELGSVSIGMNPPVRELDPFDPRLLEAHTARLTAGIVSLRFGANVDGDGDPDQTMTVLLQARDLTVDELPVLRRGVLQGDLAPDVYELGH